MKFLLFLILFVMGCTYVPRTVEVQTVKTCVNPVVTQVHQSVLEARCPYPHYNVYATLSNGQVAWICNATVGQEVKLCN